MTHTEDIIVIGGGLMGSSAAWELAKYGKKVLLLERQSQRYDYGSSYGDARITRSLGAKKDIFSFVQRTTVAEVKSLVRYLNSLSLNPSHSMQDIYRTSPVSYLFHREQQQAEIAEICQRRQRTKYKKAVGDAAFRKFGVTLPTDYLLIREYQKYSGTFNPQRLIEKLHTGIVYKGSTVCYNRQVRKITRQDDGYAIEVVHTKNNKVTRYYAKQVVVAVGAYTPQLLGKMAPYFKKLLIPKSIPLSFFSVRKKRYSRLTEAERKSIFAAHPVFNQTGKMYFAMLERVHKSGSPLFKVGGHKIRRNIIDLDRIWREPVPAKQVKWAKKQFRKYLEMLEIYVDRKDIEHVKSYYCVYTMTASEIPLVTPILTPDRKVDSNLVVMSGMSGVGAKGCLAYGLLAADFLLDIEKDSKIYQKTKKALSSPQLRLNIKKRTTYRLF